MGLPQLPRLAALMSHGNVFKTGEMSAAGHRGEHKIKIRHSRLSDQREGSREGIPHKSPPGGLSGNKQSDDGGYRGAALNNDRMQGG